MAYGSIPTGPSELYLQLLKGEITPEIYAKRAKKKLQAESSERPKKGRRTATQRQRATRRWPA